MAMYPEGMCSALELNKNTLRPGRIVAAWLAIGKPALLPWAGFARSELLEWWRKKGGELVDVPAHRFAERNKITGKLIWDDIPEGLIVRGLVERNNGKPHLKIVTRASTEEELAHYEHPRMPLLEQPLFSSEIVPMIAESAQGELF